MSYRDATPKSQPPNPVVDVDKEADQLEEEERKHKELDRELRGKVSSEEVYDALQYFLLLDPERQIEQLGGSEGQLAQGDKAKSEGDLQLARGSYENAAKIEIYRQNEEEARKYLNLAAEITGPENRDYKIQKVLLSDMEEVMRLAKDYYGKMKTTVPG